MSQKDVKKTTVRNCTDKPLVLKEGNAGVYRTLTTLQVGSEYTINCNTSATYREYWVGVRPDSTQSQANATPPQAPDIVTITSDDCAAYRRLQIISSQANSACLEVVYEKPRIRGSTMLANHTGHPVTVETRENFTSKEEVLQPNRKVAIQVGAKHGLEHSVKVGAQTLPIDNKIAAKTQAVNIITSPQGDDAKLDMVPKEWLQTEVTNKTKAEVAVRVNGHDHLLRPNEKYTIAHDPKSKDSTYSVKCSGAKKQHDISLDDISKYECIEVESTASATDDKSGASATEIVLKVPRSATNSTNVGLLSKVGLKLKGWSPW